MERRKLRSNLEPGTALWAGRRAQWRSLGISDEDMQKPKIAVINTSSELASCFTHLDGIAALAKQAIRAAGGLPFEVRTAAPSDFITSVGRGGAYILPSRDLIANDIEVQVEGARLDGMLCLASCDKTTPGQMMAAGRLNIPTIVAICGYQQSGQYKGEHIDIEEVFFRSSGVPLGKITIEELGAMADQAVRSPGVCAGMGTANSMHILCEALGMALPGSAPVLANSPKMKEYIQQCGERIVQMVWDDVKPRDIITKESVANATMVTLALSGSINCVKHLQATASEAGLDVDIYGLFADYADKIPLLAAVRPNGEELIEELEEAGGARAVMKRLERFMYKDARNVSGQTVGEILGTAPIKNDGIIRSVDAPLSTRPTINIVRGSLLPGGGICRLGGAGERRLKMTGRANIFHSRDEALQAITDGKVKAGDVVILRGLGVIGGPGMAMTSAVVFAIENAGLIDQVGVITEGQLSGLVNRGLVVGEASPEAAAGGPIAFVENGDPISIDIAAKRVDLDVSDSIMAERRKKQPTFGAQNERGWLSVYQRTVRPVHKGAILD